MEQYLFGKKSLLEAIEHNLEIDYVILQKDNHSLEKYLKNIKVKFVNHDFFEQFKNVNHQKIITVLKNKISYLSLDQWLDKHKDNKNNITLVMLDENEDPRNFGSILRSCAAFNVDGIIYKNNHQAQINDLVIKTSMGAVYYLDLIKVANLNQSIEKLKQNGFWIYASSLSEHSINLQQLDFDKRSVIILGNENHGISQLVLKKSDFIFKIPMSDKIQSLNISVAAGIILNKRFNSFN